MDNQQLQQEVLILKNVWDIVIAQRYAIFVSTTLLVYDHILTFGDEVTYVWKSKQSIWNPGSMLFLAVRYLTPFGLIFSTFSLFPIWSTEACTTYYDSNFAIIITCIVLTLGVWSMILRTYALYNRSLVVLFFLLFLWMVMLGLMIVGNKSGERTNPPDWVIASTRLCLVGRTLGPVSSVYFVGMLIVDTTVFIMTLWKLQRMMRLRIKELTDSELVNLLFRDGIMYWVVVCLTHCFNFLFMLFGRNVYKSLGVSFSQSLSTMLVCRLLLRLQKRADVHRRTTWNPYCTHTTSISGAQVFTSHLIQFFEDGLNQCPQCLMELGDPQSIKCPEINISLLNLENFNSVPRAGDPNLPSDDNVFIQCSSSTAQNESGPRAETAEICSLSV